MQVPGTFTALAALAALVAALTVSFTQPAHDSNAAVDNKTPPMMRVTPAHVLGTHVVKWVR